MQQPNKSLTYTGLADKVASNNLADQRNAYNSIKDIQQLQENNGTSMDYQTAQKLKTIFDEMQEKNDNFHYVERSKSIINEIFDSVKNNIKQMITNGYIQYRLL